MNHITWATTEDTWADNCVREIGIAALCSGLTQYSESCYREDGHGDMGMSWDNYGNGIGCGGDGHGTIFGDGQSNTYEAEWPDDQS